MTQAQLHAALAGAAEAEYAAFSSKLLGGAQKPLLGVRLPFCAGWRHGSCVKTAARRFRFARAGSILRT